MSTQAHSSQGHSGQGHSGQGHSGQEHNRSGATAAAAGQDDRTDSQADAPPAEQPHPHATGMNKAPHSNHGNTVAAWVTVGLLMLAALIMCIAVVLTNKWVFGAGLILAIIALVIGKALSKASYGMPRPDDNTVTRGVR